MKLAYPFAKSSDPNRYTRKDRLPYRLLSFKDRVLDLTRPVEVYRNLRGGKGQKYSIRQDGVVVAHADEMMLRDTRFVVRESGRRRVLATGRKNVHAWIRGYLIGSAMGTCLERESLPYQLWYSPAIAPQFTSDTGIPAYGATAVMIRKGITAAYVDWR